MLKIQLDNARDRFLVGTGRIAQLSVLSHEASVVLGTHMGRTAYLKDHTADEIMEYGDAFPDLQQYIDKYGPRDGYWRWGRSLPRKVSRLLYQQALVFLVTIFETFIEDVLLVVFHVQPRCLSSGRTISWEKVIELGNYDSIVHDFASHRAAEVLSGDWYKIVQEFNKLFNIDLNSEIDGKAVAEIFEIRHAIVHNAGVVDGRFVNKVQQSEWRIKYSLGKEIGLNRQALERMVSYVEYAATSIYESMLSKFGTN